MRRYPIHSDFKRYARLIPPITRQTLPLLRAAQHLLPLPSPKKAGVILHRVMIRQGVHSIEAQLIEPMKKNDPLPALVYFHGGGFVLEAAPYHYALAMTYAAHTPCKVLFVRYHLAPQHPFPLPAEECFAAYLWTLRHVKTLGIREGTIAVGGDSAGGNLAAATALMARDRSILPPCAQLLVYPVIDHRMQSASMRRFTDTRCGTACFLKRCGSSICLPCLRSIRSMRHCCWRRLCTIFRRPMWKAHSLTVCTMKGSLTRRRCALPVSLSPCMRQKGRCTATTSCRTVRSHRTASRSGSLS